MKTKTIVTYTIKNVFFSLFPYYMCNLKKKHGGGGGRNYTSSTISFNSINKHENQSVTDNHLAPAKPYRQTTGRPAYRQIIPLRCLL